MSTVLELRDEAKELRDVIVKISKDAHGEMVSASTKTKNPFSKLNKDELMNYITLAKAWLAKNYVAKKKAIDSAAKVSNCASDSVIEKKMPLKAELLNKAEGLFNDGRIDKKPTKKLTIAQLNELIDGADNKVSAPAADKVYESLTVNNIVNAINGLSVSDKKQVFAQIIDKSIS